MLILIIIWVKKSSDDSTMPLPELHQVNETSMFSRNHFNAFIYIFQVF